MPSPSKNLLFKKGTFLAVLGDDDDFWLCWNNQHVYLETGFFDIGWFEKVTNVGKDDVYVKHAAVNSVNLASVIGKVTLIRESSSPEFSKRKSTSSDALYRLPESEKLKIEKILKLKKEGYILNVYEKDFKEERTCDVLVLEHPEGLEADKNDEEREKNSDNVKSRKRKSSNKICLCCLNDSMTSKSRKGCTTCATKKAKKENVSNKTKRKTSGQKTKRISGQSKKITKVKKVIDKTNPNWRLKPNESVTVWTKDPLFEGKEPVPFVSSIAHSKLVMRAVIINDIDLLNICIKNGKEIMSINYRRSMASDMTPVDYAVKTQNMKAIEALLKEATLPHSNKVDRCGPPLCLLPTTGTGVYNYRSLGVRNIRRLNVSRGAREGNNAFTKDQDSEMNPDSMMSNVEEHIMRWNMPIKFINNLIKLKEYKKLKGENSSIEQGFIEKISTAVQYGNNELAAHFITIDTKRGSQEFSRYFKEALIMTGDPWEGTTVREVSARKKADWEHNNITPMHCACINPNTGPLESLFKICPDLYIADKMQRKLVHYAAACKGTKPLEFLAAKGANLEDTDKDGRTPLMTACEVGRVQSAKFIIQKLSQNESEVLSKFGAAGVDRPAKDSWCPLHIAVENGNHQVVQLLLDSGAKADKPLNTKHDSMTPLILAAANADLEMVKILVKKAKIIKPDRYKKTALTHAVINGAANVVSYLLSLGADPNKTDSSENSNLHYACAYGWWFCMKVLIDAGAKVDAFNEWKLTPLGVSLLKGNKGIANHLIKMPNIDINIKDEKGRSILMNMVVDQKDTITEEYLKDLREFVELRGANPKLVDNDGKNVLHYLAAYNYDISRDKKDKKNESMKRIEMLNKVFDFFLEKGVSVFQADNTDSSGTLPIVAALKNKSVEEYDDNDAEKHGHKQTNTRLVFRILDQMMAEFKTAYPEKLQDEAENHCYEIISTFSDTASLFYAKEDYKVFEALVKYFNCLIQEKKLKGMEFTNVENERYKTPFAKLCATYANRSLEATSRYGSWAKTKLTETEQREYWEAYYKILEEYIVTFKPKLQYHTPDKENPKIIHKFSCILTLYTANDYKIGLRNILKHKPNIDEEDDDINPGFTCLEKFIQNQDESGIKLMVEAGADVNHIQREKTVVLPDGSEKVPSLSCPIHMAVKKMNLNITDLLIKKGAIMHTVPTIGISLIHTAVVICAQNKSRNNLALVKLLLDSGSNINEKDANYRTPLHIAVNQGKDRSDESLDLEIMLMKRGADLNILDKRLRLPLHYAFVKIREHTDRSPSDPIQIVSTIVDAMDKEKLDQVDLYGCSPLHYAAYHGATVCSLLLIQKGANIDAVDHHGHTPISYAVLGKHDSCALMLIQKDANINVKIKPAELFASKTQVTKSLGLWKFLPEHWPKEEKMVEYSLFQGIVTNDWLGITYVVIGKLEMFGMSFARALEVALKINKFQFAKTLINKQVNEAKLNEIVSKGRNLINCLAFESPASSKGDKGSRSVELQTDVFNLLIEARVRPDLSDDYGCLPLHYACLKHNFNLVNLLMTKSEVLSKINEKDSFGRTAVAAALWNYDKGENSSMAAIINILIEKGAKLNFLFKSKPLSVLRQAYNAEDLSADYLDFNISTQVSPLMVALIHQDKSMITHLLTSGATVTLTDSMGVSPIMYAVKTNDTDLVSDFVNEAIKKSPQKGANNLAVNMDCVDCVDKRGQGLLHHTLAINNYYENSPTYDNPQMMELVLKSGINKSATQKGIKTPLEVAKHIGADEMGEVLAESIGVSYDPSLHLPSKIIDPKEMQKINGKSYDMVNDAEKMVEKVEKELQDKMDTNGPEKRPVQHGCTVTTGHIHEDYEVLMNKVDVSIGAWGLYNFYRMQIWKEEHKDLYILFTNWGRIETYGRGQYQNTPFSTAEAAVEEFCKIFKAKAGNDWNDREVFINKPKKYRLVQVEHTQKVIRPKISFDLKTPKASCLPKTISRVVRDMTNVNMITEAYKYEVNVDTGSIPFGRIKKEAIIEARKLLDKMEPLMILKEKLDKEKYEEKDEEKQQKALDELGSTVNKLCTLSSEYYYLLPTSGFEYEKVRPIDSQHKLNEEKKRLAYILEFEIAERMLLGAMFQKKTINPADYIYKGLGCKLKILDEKCQESQLIMNYMYKSKGATGLRVEGIYQLEREDEVGLFNSASEAANRKLLWHGTKLVNMLSLLNKGLIINPPYAERTGRMFGDGLYFADVFDKSYTYTHDGRRGYARNMSEYMLLCDVNLGNCKKLETYDTWRSDPITKEDMVGFDSLCVIGINGPDESVNVKINGFCVPLGSIKKSELEHFSYRKLSYNEYIVFDEARVVVRYLIKIGDGKNKDDEDAVDNGKDNKVVDEDVSEDDDDDRSCSSEGSTD